MSGGCLREKLSKICSFVGDDLCVVPLLNQSFCFPVPSSELVWTSSRGASAPGGATANLCYRSAVPPLPSKWFIFTNLKQINPTCNNHLLWCCLSEHFPLTFFALVTPVQATWFAFSIPSPTWIAPVLYTACLPCTMEASHTHRRTICWVHLKHSIMMGSLPA